MQKHYGISFYKKIFLIFLFIWLIGPFECLILTILTSTKCVQNLFRESTLSVISIIKKISILGFLDNAENIKRQFFLDTRYQVVTWSKNPLSFLFLPAKLTHQPNSVWSWIIQLSRTCFCQTNLYFANQLSCYIYSEF